MRRPLTEEDLKDAYIEGMQHSEYFLVLLPWCEACEEEAVWQDDPDVDKNGDHYEAAWRDSRARLKTL